MKDFFDCYSRLLIDNHITDLKPEYMSKFDPAKYVAMVKLAKIESAMVYSCDHNGNCYYPTRVGHIHNSCRDRDIFGETIALLRAADIVPVAYYTTIYHNDSAKRHPEWNIRDYNGTNHHNRYYHNCPNNEEFTRFTEQQLAEVLAYPVAAIFIDMTFWPTVCCCPSCRAKYGREIPAVMDWSNPEWVKFQRWRESSLAEFAQRLTDFAKKTRPGVAVTHQFSPVLHGWSYGQSTALAAASDYSSGDFYGGSLQQRLGTKVFAAYSKKQPYEFMTSRCVDLNDHTSTKSDDELFLHAATTLANGGAYFFIDAINPDGTLEEKFYRRLHALADRLRPYREFAETFRPELKAEVAVYFSMASAVNETHNGSRLAAPPENNANNMGVRHYPLLDEIIGTAAVLSSLHIPYTVITDATGDLSGYRAIVINNAMAMSESEVGRIREYVRNGGTLLATGKTSLQQLDGGGNGNFQLADVLNVNYSGADGGKISYIRFEDEFISAKGWPVPLVSANNPAEIRARLSLPDFPVNDAEQYASIHSNPPGPLTDYVGLSDHRYGKGRALYLATGLLALQQYSQQEFGRRIFAEILPALVVAEHNLGRETEVTLLKTNQPKVWVLGLVNYQSSLPNIPLRDVRFTVRLPFGIKAGKITRVSDGQKQPFTAANDTITIAIDQLNDIELLKLEE